VAGNLKRVTRGKVGKGVKAKLEKATPGFIKINTHSEGNKFPGEGSCKCWVATKFERTTCRKSGFGSTLCKGGKENAAQLSYATIKVCKTHSDNGRPYKTVKCASRRQLIACFKKKTGRECTPEELMVAITL